MAAGAVGLFLGFQPGRSVAQTHSTNTVESAPTTNNKKEPEKKKSSPAKKAAPRKAFTPTTKVPVGMPIDFPVDI
jgi:hypothetical protein